MCVACASQAALKLQKDGHNTTASTSGYMQRRTRLIMQHLVM
jgi:hypothetical protein